MAPPFHGYTGHDLKKLDMAKAKYEKNCITVEGIVSEEGQGGWETEGAMIHSLTLAAWKLSEGEVVEKRMNLLRPVRSLTKAEYDRFPAYKLVRLKVLCTTDRFRAIVEKSLPYPKPDKALAALAQRLSKPVVHQSDQFGELVLNKRIGWFETRAQWNGMSVDVSLTPDSTGSLDTALRTAKRLWSAQKSWKRKVDQYAVQDLLPVKNNSWLNDDERKLTPKQFVTRMRLESISIDDEGGFDFWHHDGDLFYGHSIQVSGSLDEGLTRADIPG